MALRGMSQANMDLGILQETKLTNGVYNRVLAGYSAVATNMPSWHCGGVAVLYQMSPRSAVETVQHFGPNVVGFQLAMGKR